MTHGLIRYQQTGDLHFVTFSCYRRRPYFGTPAARSLFQRSLESMRLRYEFFLTGYVIMPEHVHLLVSEPKGRTLSKALQALKLSVAVQSCERPFWQARYYDFNVYTPGKRFEKLNYMHDNPMRRGLVADPQSWEWSSCRHYSTGLSSTVEIESTWTAHRRNCAAAVTHVSEARPRAPTVVVDP